MRRLFLALIVLGVVATLAGAAFCDAQEDYGRGHMMGPGCDWGSGNMMGHGYMMGPGYMGRGHRMDSGRHGPGMYGSGRPSLKPEDRQKWDKMRAAHLKDTLELRTKLATKQIELETLWAQPNVDSKKVEKLSDEVGELRRKLWTKRDRHQLQCRKQFGDQGWMCPGGW